MKTKKLQTEQIAAFGLTATFQSLDEQMMELLKRHLLDSLGSLFFSVGEPPVAKLYKQINDLQGGAHSIAELPMDRMAQYYTALIRYPDFMDNYMGKEATCHPSDNLGALLAVAKTKKISGKEFLTAMAVAYEIECRLVEEIPVMKEGIDHTLFLAFSIVTSASRLLGLNERQISNALGIAGCSISPMVTSRASYTSEWKGMASSLEALVCINVIKMAQYEMTGPVALFEGPKGFAEIFDMKLDYDWSNEDFCLLEKCSLKSYNAEVHTQSSIEAALEIHRMFKFNPADIESVDIKTFLTAYHITGSGAYGDRRNVQSKEQGDHSLFYTVAVALLDGEVYPEQMTAQRILRSDVQELLEKISVDTKVPFHKPVMLAGMMDPYTLAYPDKVKTKVTIHLKNGTTYSREKDDYEGFYTRPLTWQMVEAKFRRLVEGKLLVEQQNEIISLVKNLEDEDDLTPLLKIIAAVSQTPAETLLH